ncbi:MAG TPA: sigma-70 family RNA polymerase sigma factor [Gemmatimonadaceae bacterium]|nr:sigma-70 family RNA polymerase sigma factor [Gemmatimonadaceae bacterium]
MSQLLLDLRAGDQDALNQLLPLVYHHLHTLAQQQRRRWTGDETLDTTALVHEAYLRLAGDSSPAWESRAHFLAVASRAMRQILVDYAKQRRRAKRGGDRGRVSLEEIEAVLERGSDPADAGSEALIALDVALDRLERRDPRQSRIVECRFFTGMSIHETAEALSISPATVKRGWIMAQAWLHRELARELALDA